MANTAKVLIWIKDITMTRLMQAADVWEPTRIVASSEVASLTFKDEVDLSLERAFEAFSGGKTLGDNKTEIVYAELLSITVDGKVIPNNGTVNPFVAKDIGTISDGEKFFVFGRYLESRGLAIETGKLMAVESAVFKEKVTA